MRNAPASTMCLAGDFVLNILCTCMDSNHGPGVYKTPALPTELHVHLARLYSNSQSVAMFICYTASTISSLNNMKKFITTLLILSAVVIILPNEIQAQTVSKCINITKRLAWGAKEPAYAGQVYALQRFLISQGYDTQVTGYFGSQTDKALRAYQRKNNLPTVGYTEEKTRAFINSRICNTTVIPSSNPVSNPVFDMLLQAVNAKNEGNGSVYDGNFDLNSDSRVNVTDLSSLNSVINKTASLAVFDTVSSKLIQAVYVRQGTSASSTNYMKQLDFNNDGWILGEDTVKARAAFNSVKPESQVGNLSILNSTENPAASSHQITAQGVTNVPILAFAAKSTSGDSLIKSMTVDWFANYGPGYPTALYLYDGSTMLASVSASSSKTVVFNNLSILVSKDNTRTYTIKMDMPANTADGTIIWSKLTGLTYQQPSGTSITLTPSIQGNQQTFVKSATAQVSLQSSSISVMPNNIGITASFVVKVKPVGGTLPLPRADYANFSLISSVGNTVYAMKTADNVTVSGYPSILSEGVEYPVTYSVMFASSSIPAGTNVLKIKMNEVRFGTLNPVTLNYLTTAVTFTKPSSSAPVTAVIVNVEGDVNGDGRVTQADLDILNSAYGSSRYDANYKATADFNNDGAVNFFDLTYLGARMGNGVVTVSLVPLGGDCNGDKTVNFSDLTKTSSIIGSKTGDALYEQGCDFNLDGFIDKYDIDILNANYGKSLSASGTVLGATVASSCVVLYQPLQRGSMDRYSDGEVTLLQNFLEGVGYGFPEKGTFGPVTEIALKDWQAKNGILATGVTGPMTRSLIQAESCN